jgi:hypothetical protein
MAVLLSDCQHETSQRAARRLRHGCCSRQARRKNMLWTIFVILLVLWLLGMVTSYTMGGFIHILLVVAIVVVLIQVIQGRKVL